MMWKNFPIGFHIGVGGNADGLVTDYLAPLDAAGIRWFLKSVDAYPKDAVDIARASNIPHTIVWRTTSYDVPDYSLDPDLAAEQHFQSTLAKIDPNFDKELVWLEAINEVDKEKADWLGRFGIYWYKRAIMHGFKKVLMFGWSSGEPEPFQWLEPGMADFLRFASVRRDSLGVSLHEYSYDAADIKRMYPFLVGRYAFLFDACDQLGISRVTTAITEWGWEYQDVPAVDQAITDIDTIAREYVEHSQILGAGLWYLGGGYGDIANQAQPLIKPTAELALSWQHYVEHEWPPTGTVPPDDGGLLLKNGSFEDGNYKWNNINEINIPNEWDFWYADNTTQNPIDSNPWAEFARPEAVNPSKASIPPEEHDQLFLDGEHIEKIFKGNGSIYFRLTQTVILDPDTYLLSLPVFPDLVKGYTSSGEKIWADDPERRDGLAKIHFGDYVSEWMSLQPGQYNVLANVTTVDTAGEYTVGLEIMLPFPLVQNGVFLDAFSLYPYTEPKPPPQTGCIDTSSDTRYHILRPRTLTDNQWAYIRKLMEDGITLGNLGHVVVGYEGWSHIDAMGAIKQAIKAGHTKSRLIIVDGDQIGTGLNSVWMDQNCPFLTPYTIWLNSADTPFAFTHWPSAAPKEITQFFGANPQNYAEFNLPGHDGVDIAAPRGTKIFCVAPGDIYRIHTDPNTHNYGIHVRVQHANGWKTIYAHLESVASGLAVGQHVASGQLLGLADNTGNSFGSHLHLGLKREGQTYVDNKGNIWPHNLFDPTMFLKPLCPACFEPTPPTGDALLGLHASADPGLAAGEVDAFKTANIELVKILSNLPENDVAALANALPGVPFVIRAYLSFGGRNVSPQEFFDWTAPDVRRAINKLGNREIIIELHNEPNLTMEGWGSSWNNGAEFSTWLSSVAAKYRYDFSGYALAYPGLSPGGDISGIRTDSKAFLMQSAPVIGELDYLGVHAYWAANWPISLALGTVDEALNLYPEATAIVTEASNNKRDTDAVTKGQEYIYFWRELQKRSRVYGVTYFVASASNDAWGWTSGSGEIWVGTSIPGTVGNR